MLHALIEFEKATGEFLEVWLGHEGAVFFCGAVTMFFVVGSILLLVAAARAHTTKE